MREAGVTLALTVVLCVVVAGCGGAPSAPGEDPTVTTVDTSDADGDDRVRVEGGSLPYDPTLAYDRVQRLLGTNRSPPTVVRRSEMGRAGLTTESGRIYLGSSKEFVLVHEYVHSILLRSTETPHARSPDQRFALDAASEGAADYVEAAYTRRYGEGDPDLVRRLPRAPSRAYVKGEYYFGYRYFERRVDAPSSVLGVYRNPPNTSEQVIHGLAPASEPPRPLSVSVAGSNGTWRHEASERLGEITVLLTMRTRLDDDRAARAASGWGNDRLVAFRDGENWGFVWVVRWDDPGNATEFLRAFERYREEYRPTSPPPVDERRTPYEPFTDVVWSSRTSSYAVDRPGPSTTVVAIGSDEFVAAASATRNGSTVTVTVG